MLARSLARSVGPVERSKFKGRKVDLGIIVRREAEGSSQVMSACSSPRRTLVDRQHDWRWTKVSALRRKLRHPRVFRSTSCAELS